MSPLQERRDSARAQGQHASASTMSKSTQRCVQPGAIHNAARKI